jgi:hypothetical protein
VNFQPLPDEQYHLLLPPEYNIPAEMADPSRYLFVERSDSQGTLRQFRGGSFSFHRKGSFLHPVDGFDQNVPCEILQTTPCTTTNGFAFDMHEIMFNPFMPSPVPPLCTEIQHGFDHPESALDFLKSRIRSPDLPAALRDLETFASRAQIGRDNRDSIVARMHEFMDGISDRIFKVKPFHFIPTIFKMRTNFIVFYAVTELFHMRLLKVYHESLQAENIAAQKATRVAVASIGDPGRLLAASAHLKTLHHMTSVVKGIAMVKRFFDVVMGALPDKNAAADDILPAVCEGIRSCTQLSSHIVSSFQYLADIWPVDGLDERTTYILVTCSIAASHFAAGPQEQPKVPLLGAHRIEVDATADSIEMLESVLNSM